MRLVHSWNVIIYRTSHAPRVGWDSYSSFQHIQIFTRLLRTSRKSSNLVSSFPSVVICKAIVDDYAASSFPNTRSKNSGVCPNGSHIEHYSMTRPFSNYALSSHLFQPFPSPVSRNYISWRKYCLPPDWFCSRHGLYGESIPSYQPVPTPNYTPGLVFLPDSVNRVTCQCVYKFQTTCHASYNEHHQVATWKIMPGRS